MRLGNITISHKSNEIVAISLSYHMSKQLSIHGVVLYSFHAPRRVMIPSNMVRTSSKSSMRHTLETSAVVAC